MRISSNEQNDENGCNSYTVRYVFLWLFSAYTPYDYESGRETKPGPGLFSGEDGAFTVYRKQEESKKRENGKNQVFVKPSADERPAE